MITRISFVTIGQTPRSDLVLEIVSRLPAPVEVGALDGLEAQRTAVAKGSDRPVLLVRRLVTSALAQRL